MYRTARWVWLKIGFCNPSASVLSWAVSPAAIALTTPNLSMSSASVFAVTFAITLCFLSPNSGTCNFYPLIKWNNFNYTWVYLSQIKQDPLQIFHLLFCMYRWLLINKSATAACLVIFTRMSILIVCFSNDGLTMVRDEVIYEYKVSSVEAFGSEISSTSF